MSNDELDVERHAGLTWSPVANHLNGFRGPDDGDPIPAFQSAYRRSPDPPATRCGIGRSGH